MPWPSVSRSDSPGIWRETQELCDTNGEVAAALDRRSPSATVGLFGATQATQTRSAAEATQPRAWIAVRRSFRPKLK